MISSSVLRLFLDLGGVEQRGDNCRRAYANGNAGLAQFLPTFFARTIVVIVAHGMLFMASRAALEVA